MAWCRQATSHYLSQCWRDPCHHMMSLGHNELNKIFSMTILYNDQYMYYVTEVTMCTTGVDVGACHWIIQHVVDTCGCMTSFLCLDFNSLIPGRCGSNFKSVISEHFHELFFVKMFWDECLRTYLMIYKSTLVQMLVMACCRQVITANKPLLEPNLPIHVSMTPYHMASLGYSELTLPWIVKHIKVATLILRSIETGGLPHVPLWEE